MGDGEINGTVRVQITEGHRERGARLVSHIVGEGAVAVVEQHRDVVGEQVGHREVRAAVPVQIADGNDERRDSGVVLDRRGEQRMRAGSGAGARVRRRTDDRPRRRLINR